MIRRFFLIISQFLLIASISAQNNPEKFSLKYPDNTDSLSSGLNELTIFIIPSKVQYDWSSPYSLYKSYFSNYKHNIFQKEKYILGHAFIELRSPLIPGTIFSGMRTVTRKEQRDLVLKQHYGLAILGADIEGELETNAELENKADKYSRKGRLAFMTFFISDEATIRLLRFFQDYKTGIDSVGSHGARYGGAFWPRYKGEGSGCSAFAVSFLDLAGLLRDEYDQWLVKINIPMDLIGGPYNHFNDVRFSDIKKYKSWAGNCNPDTTCYEPLEIYDPSLMYEWIVKTAYKADSIDDLRVTPMMLNQAKGIRIDCRYVRVPKDEEIFMEREKTSIFIDYYHQKYGSGH